jgi:Flp pilus assembly pilin Flp
MTAVNSFFKAEFAQDVIEYALLCALVALTGVGLAVSIGLNVDTAYSTINSKNQKAHGNAFGKGHGSGNPGQGNPGGNGDGNGNP